MMQPVYNTILVGSFVVMMLSVADAATVAREVNTANKLYGFGKFEEALEHYQKALARDPHSALVEYNLGTAHYKKNQFAESIEHLQKALLADDRELQQKARYNLGNALYKQGISKEGSDLSGAISDIERSLGHYEKNSTAIAKDPDNQSNFEFVKSELQRLKDKQQQQQQQQQNKPKESQQQDDQQKTDQNDQKQQQDPKADQSKKESSQDPENDNKGSDEKKDGSGQGDQRQDEKGQKGDAPRDKPENNDRQPKNNFGDGKSGPQGIKQSPDGAQPDGQGLMTPQEAQMMLDDYQRNDEPKGMLYFKPQPDNSKTVIKDW